MTEDSTRAVDTQATLREGRAERKPRYASLCSGAAA